MQSNHTEERKKNAEDIPNEQNLPPSWFSIGLNSMWNTTKQTGSMVLNKIVNLFSAIISITNFNEYEYIPPRDESRLYVANEIPYEFEPVLSYLSGGQNGFVVEDDDGEVRSLIINIDMLDCTKIVVLLMGINTMMLLLLFFVRTVCPGFYNDLKRQLVF